MISRTAGLVLVLVLIDCRKTPENPISLSETESEPPPASVVVIKEGDILGIVLDKALDGEDYAKALRAVDSVIGAKKIRPGDTLKFYMANGRLTRLDYIRGFNTTRFDFAGEGFKTKSIIPDFVKRVEFVRGEVDQNLYLSFLEIGEKDPVLIQFADIFGWDIDFTTECQKGDSFFFVVEKNYLADTVAFYGPVLWAEYDGKSVGKHVAYRFKGEYYNSEGRSLRKEFLKSPLKVYRISSGYSKSRFHPILKVYRPHKGVDYAAPAGTPVHALGEGTVAFAGWKGGYGKYVRIKHPNGFQTGYGHLSRIAVRSGQRVSQGQIIGYVGSTGLATGPHLHFEMFKGGSFANPLTVKTPPANPVPADEMEEFKNLVSFTDGCIRRIRGSSD
ncbi:MAG: M23 family metallopeptidase [candidate division WOR-3 bacterium]